MWFEEFWELHILLLGIKGLALKFIYSEKATKFCEIFTLLLTSTRSICHICRKRALCVQMDFTRTFEANPKCNNIRYVWSHFYQILVVLKYHRGLWNNIFDTGIFRCINTHIKGVYLAFFGIFMLLEMSVSKILFHRRLWYFRTTKIW